MPEIKLLIVAFVWGLTVIVNLVVLALNLKLYTEFAKQRMQESRKSVASDLTIGPTLEQVDNE